MKSLRKIMALLIAMTMVIGMSVAVFAQTVGTAAEGKGSITIKNAAKGEKYGVVKLFDATVGANGQIAYTGTIPETLNDYFVKDSAGNITKKTGVEDSALTAEVQAWAANQSPQLTTSDGTALTFAGLDYGYYAVKSSQGTVITIDSTTPNATVVDKNSKTITAAKTVDKTSYSIGDTITYTASFDTVNWYGAGNDAKQVINYEIQDTLPEFLSNVNVTSITVGGTPIETKQFVDKKISIPWATEDTGSNPKTYTNIYDNGAKIVITYTAKLTSVTNINADDTNTVSIHPTTWNGTTEEKPWDESWQKDAKIKTYAAALKKVDGKGTETAADDTALPGAKFTIKGLTVTGSNGVYTVTGYNSAADAAESAVLDTDAEGKLYIIGLAENVSLTVTEYKAPNGYNKLTAPTSVPVQIMNETIYKESGTINYDAKGNVVSEQSSSTTSKTVTKNLSDLDGTAVSVVNNAGSELPSTGGIGTTIFYVIGGILVAGAAIILIAKRKTNA